MFVISIVAVSSNLYVIRMTLKKGEDTLIWRRKLLIARCGELALEEAWDLS